LPAPLSTIAQAVLGEEDLMSTFRFSNKMRSHSSNPPAPVEDPEGTEKTLEMPADLLDLPAEPEDDRVSAAGF
jgi:hypothetical protein